MNKDKKSEVVSELTNKFNEFKYIYVTDVSTLNAQKTNELRREFFKGGIEMEVSKNTLIRKAMENTGKDYGALTDTLKGNTALLFSTEAKAPANIIKAFRKQGDRPHLKGAYIDTDVYIGDDQLEALMRLKSKNELIGEVLGMLQSPAQNVISALQSGKNKLAGIVKTLGDRPE
jgi:large subunit ribosomal protein L10